MSHRSDQIFVVVFFDSLQNNHTHTQLTSIAARRWASLINNRSASDIASAASGGTRFVVAFAVPLALAVATSCLLMAGGIVGDGRALLLILFIIWCYVKGLFRFSWLSSIIRNASNVGAAVRCQFN